jgi:hypothetical protein
MDEQLCGRQPADAYCQIPSTTPRTPHNSTHWFVLAERSTASITACTRAPSWKLGVHGRECRMASTNSQAWS